MEYYVDHQQMKAIDHYSIDTAGIPSMVLMERAALAVSEYIMERYTPLDGVILSVCGMGNNGADGLAAARILALKGYQTAVLALGKQQKATKEWQQQKFILDQLGISQKVFESGCETEFSEYIKETHAAVIIDALFGIGLTRTVEGSFAELIYAVNHSGKTVIAVDIPSGIHTDKGTIEGTAVRADATVTFGYKKTGQLLYPGAQMCGELKVCEVGFAPDAIKKTGFAACGFSRIDWQTCLKNRPADSHKGTFGKVLVIAGCPVMCGAAVFSAKAAYRSGCGLVKVFTTAENRSAVYEKVPEAILGIYNPESESELEGQLKDSLLWADAVVFGPGIGQEEYVHTMLKYLLYHSEKAFVLDADGIRVLAEHPDWYEKLAGRAILTPHLGEMAALTGVDILQLRKDPAGAAADFSRKYHCICVLKGARTITAFGEDYYYLNTSGCSAMATAGSGDVLTGIIAALMCEQPSLRRAAALGVWIHGLAGEKAAERYGNRSVIASDLIEALAEVFS